MLDNEALAIAKIVAPTAQPRGCPESGSSSTDSSTRATGPLLRDLYKGDVYDCPLIGVARVYFKIFVCFSAC